MDTNKKYMTLAIIVASLTIFYRLPNGFFDALKEVAQIAVVFINGILFEKWKKMSD